MEDQRRPERRAAALLAAAACLCALVLWVPSGGSGNELLTWKAVDAPMPLTVGESQRRRTQEALESKQRALSQKLYAALQLEDGVKAAQVESLTRLESKAKRLASELGVQRTAAEDGRQQMLSQGFTAKIPTSSSSSASPSSVILHVDGSQSKEPINVNIYMPGNALSDAHSSQIVREKLQMLRSKERSSRIARELESQGKEISELKSALAGRSSPSAPSSSALSLAPQQGRLQSLVLSQEEGRRAASSGTDQELAAGEKAQAGGAMSVAEQLRDLARFTDQEQRDVSDLSGINPPMRSMRSAGGDDAADKGSRVVHEARPVQETLGSLHVKDSMASKTEQEEEALEKVEDDARQQHDDDETAQQQHDNEEAAVQQHDDETHVHIPEASSEPGAQMKSKGDPQWKVDSASSGHNGEAGQKSDATEVAGEVKENASTDGIDEASYAESKRPVRSRADQGGLGSVRQHVVQAAVHTDHHGQLASSSLQTEEQKEFDALQAAAGSVPQVQITGSLSDIISRPEFEAMQKDNILYGVGNGAPHPSRAKSDNVFGSFGDDGGDADKQQERGSVSSLNQKMLRSLEKAAGLESDF